MGMHVLICGNVVDGIVIYGPFATADEASDAAVNEKREWLVVQLCSPEEL